MKVSIEELMQGQSTVIKNKEYFATERYIKPFIDRMAPVADHFECRAIQPTQLSIGRNGEINSIYNKVLIEAVNTIENDYAEVVGMAYAIDTKKPVCKFFKGIKDNLDYGYLFIDNNTNIVSQELEPETNLNYSLLDSLLDKETQTMDWMKSLKTIDFNASNDEVNYKLGQWIRFAINCNLSDEFGSIKIASQDIIAGYKELFEDSKSDFYCGLGVHTNYFEIYKSFSNVIYEGKDIINIADKTYLLKLILSLV